MQKIEGVPDGWELVRIGLINPYDSHEHCIDPDGEIVKTFGVMGKVNENYPIIRKLPTWRPAKPSDLETQAEWKARFCNGSESWTDGIYCGYRTDCGYRFINKNDDLTYQFCEVQDNG